MGGELLTATVRNERTHYDLSGIDKPLYKETLAGKRLEEFVEVATSQLSEEELRGLEAAAVSLSPDANSIVFMTS